MTQEKGQEKQATEEKGVAKEADEQKTFKGITIFKLLINIL